MRHPRGPAAASATAVDVDGYLARLGVARPARPTAEALRALHVAHVERVPYETFDLYLRRPPGLAAGPAAARVVGGRGGFCYHLNGAFALLLDALGFRVTLHRAEVYGRDQQTPPQRGNHLALTVAGLPSSGCPDGHWMVDVGLGEGLYEPIPLRAGRYRQGPFEYGLRPSTALPGGWRFEHDPAGTFAAVEMAAGPAGPDDFEATGRWLSSSPESPFVRSAIAERRDADGVDVLVGCLFTRIDAAGRRSTTVDRGEDWFGLLRERFGLAMADYDAATRTRLWRMVRLQHHLQQRS